MVTAKMGTRSLTTRTLLQSLKQIWYKFGQSSINQIVIEWDQVSKCMQSVCDNTKINYKHLTTYTEINFNSLYKLFTIRVQPEPHRFKAVIQKFLHK